MILRHSFLFVLSCASIILKETYGSRIPGIPGRDFPNFREIPPTSFRCPDSRRGRFYPDFETRCQVFHYCEDGNKDSFICPIGTVFNPLIQSCDRWFNYECESPVNYDRESGYDRNKADYEVASDGDVAGSLIQSGSDLFDKMASLYDDGGAYGQYDVENTRGLNSVQDRYSEYGGSRERFENEESRNEVSEISRGDANLNPEQNEGVDNRRHRYESHDRNAEGSETNVSEDGAHLKDRGQAHSLVEIGLEINRGSESKHSSPSVRADRYDSELDSIDQSSNGLRGMYYRKPEVYKYHTKPNEYNREQTGESVSYGEDAYNAEGESYSSVYENDMEYDDYEGNFVDSDRSTDLQKRISEYRRRHRPKPVVSLVESDLEIVTLPSNRPKRPRISLMQHNSDPSVTEPMRPTTEHSTNAQQESEILASSSELKEESKDDERSNIQQERRENESDFGDGYLEESSGDAEDFRQERRENERDFEGGFPEESSGEVEDFLQSNEFDGEPLDYKGESERTDADVEQLHNKMRPNVVHVDSNTDYVMNDKPSDADEEGYYGTAGDNYENDELSVDHGVNADEYNGYFNDEVGDTSEVISSNEYGDRESLDSEKHRYENREDYVDYGENTEGYNYDDSITNNDIEDLSEATENNQYGDDFGSETYQNEDRFEDSDGFGETDYLPDWADSETEEERSNEVLLQLEESLDGYSDTSNQAPKGYSDYSDEFYYRDDGFSRDSAPDSARDYSEEVTFVPIPEEASEGSAYDYGDSINPIENVYEGEDIGYSNDQSYTGENPSLEEQENIEDLVSSDAEDATSSSDAIYYYDSDMGSQFVTDQPDMEIASTIIGAEHSPDTGIQGDSEYYYETSQTDGSDSHVEYQEEYFTTDSSISDTAAQFVTDQQDFVLSSTAELEEYQRNTGETDVEFTDHTETYVSDLDTTFVTIEPDLEMSSIAMNDGEEHTEDGNVHTELRSAFETSHSDDAELSNRNETKTESDVSSGIFSNVNSKIPDKHKAIGLHSSHKKHKTMSETSSDSSGVETFPDFDFDSTGDTHDMESTEEDSESPTDQSPSISDTDVKSTCPTCPFSVGSKIKSRSFFRSEELMDLDGSRHPARTGKLLDGSSKLAKLASFVKKMIAAKKKAKIEIVKKILPSSERNNET